MRCASTLPCWVAFCIQSTGIHGLAQVPVHAVPVRGSNDDGWVRRFAGVTMMGGCDVRYGETHFKLNASARVEPSALSTFHPLVQRASAEREAAWFRERCSAVVSTVAWGKRKGSYRLRCTVSSASFLR